MSIHITSVAPDAVPAGVHTGCARAGEMQHTKIIQNNAIRTLARRATVEGSQMEYSFFIFQL
ncbi:MAG TPA: hypothetical protein VFH95_05070 [Candidatus Kapabacteria bacterium]|nr:hypothetical protein [Candidatus Kapabacteria bacterium]